MLSTHSSAKAVPSTVSAVKEVLLLLKLVLLTVRWLAVMYAVSHRMFTAASEEAVVCSDACARK